jgi:hypothetical protein
MRVCGYRQKEKKSVALFFKTSSNKSSGKFRKLEKKGAGV